MRKEKQNIMSSQNESMLVSQRKPFDNLIKISKCQCMGLLKNIETKVDLFELRLEQITANINICFTKHAQLFGKFVDEQKKRQHVEYSFWDMKEINQAIQQKINNQLIKQQQSVLNLGEQVQTWTRVLRDVKSWKNNYNNWSSTLQKNVFDMYKTHRQQNDEKLRKMYEAVEQIGVLQRKMLEKSQSQIVQRKSRTASYCQRQPERHSIASKKSSYNNESTMIYASRHYK